jgi:hypothetical protein
MPVLLLSALVGLAPAQTVADPVAVARRIDAALEKLAKVEGEGLMRVQLPAGSGFSKTKLFVQDPKRFAIQFTDVFARGVASGEVRSDGTRKAWMDNSRTDGWKAKWEPLTKSARPFSRSGSELLKAFPTEFPRLVYAPLTTGKGVFADLVASAKRAGYTVQIGEREVAAQDRTLKNWQIVLANPASKQKAEGVLRIEIQANQTFNLPVSIYSTRKDSAGNTTRLAWTMGWHRAPQAQPALFRIPK